MKGLECSVCKTDKHQSTFAKDGFYVCSDCGKPLGYYCKGCDRVYLENRLGFHTDVFVCKVCGEIQWGYTDWKTKKGRDY